MLIRSSLNSLFAVETSTWNAEEIETYQQAMMKYDKDFFLVSKEVSIHMCFCLLDLLFVELDKGAIFFQCYLGMLNWFFPNSKFISKIRILFELRLGLQ